METSPNDEMVPILDEHDEIIWVYASDYYGWQPDTGQDQADVLT